MMRPLASRLAALSIAATLSAPAGAQVTAGALPQTDPWGVGWIGANEGPLAPTIWANTSEATLTGLLGALKPGELAPSARQALRRVLMSRAKGPGGPGLIPERLRLLEELGENGNALDLRRRYPEQDWGQNADRMLAEFGLVSGQESASCSAAQRQSDPSWRGIRAFCAALSDDPAAASLLAEQIALADEKMGLWLLEALSVIHAPDLKKPEGRYGTALEVAVSVAAQLPAPANAMAGLPADIAAGVATNPAATPAQRRAALGVAVQAGRLKAADVAAVLSLPAEAPAPVRGAPPRPDLLAQAVMLSGDESAAPAVRAASYAAALRAAATLTDAHIAALALLPAIGALPRDETTLTYAEPFARASLLAGDRAQAEAWRGLLWSLPDDKQDQWAMARLDLMLGLAGTTLADPARALDLMIAGTQSRPEGRSATGASSGEQQQSVRRIETTRVLFLHVGLGRPLSPDQRTLLASMRTAGRGVPDAAIARITAAGRQEAYGEAALSLIALLGPDVSALSFAGLADLLTQMQVIGMGRDAEAIALESMQPWRAF